MLNARTFMVFFERNSSERPATGSAAGRVCCHGNRSQHYCQQTITSCYDATQWLSLYNVSSDAFQNAKRDVSKGSRRFWIGTNTAMTPVFNQYRPKKRILSRHIPTCNCILSATFAHCRYNVEKDRH